MLEILIPPIGRRSEIRATELSRPAMAEVGEHIAMVEAERTKGFSNVRRLSGFLLRLLHPLPIRQYVFPSFCDWQFNHCRDPLRFRVYHQTWRWFGPKSHSIPFAIADYFVWMRMRCRSNYRWTKVIHCLHEVFMDQCVLLLQPAAIPDPSNRSLRQNVDDVYQNMCIRSRLGVYSLAHSDLLCLSWADAWAGMMYFYSI